MYPIANNLVWKFIVVAIFTSLAISLSAQKVGINTDSPQFTLDIKDLEGNGATIELKDHSELYNLRLFSGDSTDINPYLAWPDSSGLRFMGIGNPNEEYLRLTTQPHGIFRMETPNSLNTFLGKEAGISFTEGSGNTFIGFEVGASQSSGFNNVYIGYDIGTTIPSTSKNIAIGGEISLGGDKNIYLGNGTGSNTGSGNIHIGTNSGFNNNGNHNIFIGKFASLPGNNKLAIQNNPAEIAQTPLISGDFETNQVGINTTLYEKDLNIFNNAEAGIHIRSNGSGLSNRSGIHLQNGDISPGAGTGVKFLIENKALSGLHFSSISNDLNLSFEDILLLKGNGEVHTQELHTTNITAKNITLTGESVLTKSAIKFNQNEPIGFNPVFSKLPWLNKGTISLVDFLYLSPSGNKSNTKQFAMLMNTSGLSFGKGTDQAVGLSEKYVSIESNFINSGKMSLFKEGASTIVFDGAETASEGSAISLFDVNGNLKVKIDADFNGNGRIITDELQINGGSDLSESFTITDPASSPKPGMLVSIDPEKDGALQLTAEKNDRKLVGVISGANGIKTGMIMGQEGTITCGEYPVALTGRVYVLCTEEGGEIAAGDFLTSSSTKGHAMKATNIHEAAGSIIGKAMTGISENGYVLVLINLQ